ncbi:MAG: photosystem II reaction center protein Z [Pseudomonadota bacterium]
MLMTLLFGLAIALAGVLSFLLVWGLPIYYINREQLVPDQEKKLWILGCVFFSWIAFLAFAMIAPVTGLRQH